MPAPKPKTAAKAAKACLFVSSPVVLPTATWEGREENQQVWLLGDGKGLIMVTPVLAIEAMAKVEHWPCPLTVTCREWLPATLMPNEFLHFKKVLIDQRCQVVKKPKATEKRLPKKGELAQGRILKLGGFGTISLILKLSSFQNFTPDPGLHLLRVLRGEEPAPTLGF